MLDQPLAIDAMAVDDFIVQNDWTAQNQTEYREHYDALVSRYEDTEKKRDAIADQISQMMVRRRKLERFIETIERLLLSQANSPSVCGTMIHHPMQ